MVYIIAIMTKIREKKFVNLFETLQLEHQTLHVGVLREVLSQSKRIRLTSDLVLAVQGVRRCGKSTLLRQIAEKEGVRDRSIFINFEDPRLSSNLNHELLDQIVKHQESKGAKYRYFFFDEIQNVKNWEKWLHVQLEKKKYHFVITGSNSTLLSGKLGTALTGRHLTIELFPFSFAEFKSLRRRASVEEYLEAGGFPRALSFEDAPDLLREYFSDIIERDVRRHVAARSSLALTQIAQAVFESTGSETSFRNLAKAFDTTPDTVKIYADAFEAAYLCLPCDYFTYSTRKRAVRPRKYYPIDLGMRASVVASASLDLGKKLETAVFHALRRSHARVSYWRGHGEVDFVIETPRGIQPIQVSWHGPKERHAKALDEFKKEFPKSLEPLYVERNTVEEWL